jgi:hypothetical protein
LAQAIALTVDRVELEQGFHGLADERWVQILATGKTAAWDEAMGAIGCSTKFVL